jgi:hypothetical protein
MMRIFLGFSFRDEDRNIVDQVDHLIASHLVDVTTGERLGGNQLTPAVQKRIEDCDALVAVLTRRDHRQDGQWTTHQWVLDEIGWARAKGKRAIALVEHGVELAGMFQPHEYILLDKAQPSEALLTLSETVGLWRKEIGRTVKVQVLPDEIAQMIVADGNGAKLRHRLWQGSTCSQWQDLTPVPEIGGTFVFVKGVQDDHLIQLQVHQANKSLESLATSQWIQVKFKSGGAGA